MIIKYEYVPLYDKNNNYRKNCKTTFQPLMEYVCDECKEQFVEKAVLFRKRIELINKEVCVKCGKSRVCRANTLKGVYDKKGKLLPNTGRFTTERVKNMSKKEYNHFCEQRRYATMCLHKKLDSDPELKRKHYEKIYKKSKIGYISKGQRNLYEYLKNDGFELEKTVEGIRCDIVNKDKKIVFEYYGDFFHANPRKYKPDDHIAVIEMKAKEKWDKDRKRNFILRNKGYTVLIIWESEWENDRNKVFDKIKKYKKQDFVFPKWKPKETQRKWIHNDKLKKNKTVLNEELESWLKNNWLLGKGRFIK